MTRQGKRTVVGPLAAHVDGFRSFALAWGYTPATTGLLVKEMRSMSACSPMSATVGVKGEESAMRKPVWNDVRRPRCGTPRFAVWGGRMNLRKQVEPLLSAALQASSAQRHAQHAAPRLTWC